MYTISIVSLTAFLKRIIESAPTSPNALARLFPMVIMTSVTISERYTMDTTKLLEYPGPLYVKRYTMEMMKLQSKLTKRLTVIWNNVGAKRSIPCRFCNIKLSYKSHCELVYSL